MHKKLTFIFILIISFQVTATDLLCNIVPGENTEHIGKKNFIITNANTKKANISFDGGLFEGPFEKNGRIITKFSNECDNMIDISFDKKLWALFKKRQTKNLFGLMNYFSSELYDLKTRDDAIKALINCKRI